MESGPRGAGRRGKSMRSVVDTRIERLTDKGNQSLEEFLEELFLTVTYIVTNGVSNGM